MNLMNLEIAPSSLGKKLLLLDVQPVHEYVNGRKTDTITAYKYEVVLVERAYEKLKIKIDGMRQLERPDEPTEVSFDGLKLGLYCVNGVYNISAKADAIHFVVKKN